MLTLAHRYEELLTSTAGSYRAGVYGQRLADGRWAGSLVFVPLGGGRVIATETETTQSTLADLAYWASGLSEVYLQGALARGLALQPEAELARELKRLEHVEVSAELRAETLERAAASARTESRMAEAARQRTEERLYETIAENAEIEAEAHEKAALRSRAAAQAAERALAGEKPKIASTKNRKRKKA